MPDTHLRQPGTAREVPIRWPRFAFRGAIVTSVLIGAQCIAAYLQERYGFRLGAHGASLPAALLPLMLPPLVRNARRANAPGPATTGSDLRWAATVDPGLPVERRPLPAGDNEPPLTRSALRRLAQANADLTAEVQELRRACARLEQDAAERESAAARLAFLAHHDPLTGLPNRVLLMDRLTHGLAAAQRSGGELLVVYLDLDRFKIINDSLGHHAGDRVLAEMGSRIAGCIRAADTASRVGGDEFVLVCTAVDGLTEGPLLAARLAAALGAPVEIDGMPLTLGASVGMSRYPADGTDAARLIEKADMAMYCAKTAGRNDFALYTPEIAGTVKRKRALEVDLRAALAEDERELHEQPG